MARELIQDGSQFFGILQKRPEAHFIIGAIILLAGEMGQQGGFVVALDTLHPGGFDQIPNLA